MLKLSNKFLLMAVLLLGGLSYVLLSKNERLKKERDTYQMNTQALLSDIKRFRIDSISTAVDVEVLKLSLKEYKKYRAEDLATIKKMGIEIKSLQAVARHELEVSAPIKTQVRDSVVIRDSVVTAIQKIEMNTPHLMINGVIENNQLIGTIHLPVTLHQAIWVEHKRKFLWWKWGVKAVHQAVSSDNPFVEIKFMEFFIVKQ